MLSEKELKEIARPVCIKLLGFNFLKKYEQYGCAFWGYLNNGMFSFGIGVDTKNIEMPEGTVLPSGESEFEYQALVCVDPNTGDVTVDQSECRIPVDIRFCDEDAFSKEL